MDLLDRILNLVAKGELTIEEAEQQLQAYLLQEQSGRLVTQTEVDRMAEVGALNLLAQKGTPQQRARLQALRVASPNSEEAQKDAAILRAAEHSPLSNFFRLLGEEVTFGLGNKLAGLSLKPLEVDPDTGLLRMPGNPLDYNAEVAAESQRRVEDIREGVSLVGEIATAGVAGFATPLGPAVVSGGRRLLGLAGKEVKRRILAGAAAAGIEGGAFAAGETEGGLGERAFAALIGAPLAAVFGGGFTALARNKQAAIRSAADDLALALDKGDDAAVVEAGEKLTTLLRESGIDAPEGRVRALRGALEDPPEGTVTLERYTPEPNIRSRTKFPGAEERRQVLTPGHSDEFEHRLNFYVAGAEPEDFATKLPYRSTVEVPRSLIYNYQQDPAGIVATFRSELGGVDPFMGSNLNRLERRVKDAGFLGFQEGPPGGTGRVALFDIPEVGMEIITEVNPRAPEATRVRAAERLTPPDPLPGSHKIDQDILASHTEFGGSTFDPRTGQSLAGEDVWAVATPIQTLYDEAPTPEQIAAFRLKHAERLKDPNLQIGTWHDSGNARHGKHELNITRTFAGEDMDGAVQFAREGEEHSILNLAHPDFEDVPVFNDPALRAYRAQLDMLVPERKERLADDFLRHATRAERRAFQRQSAKNQDLILSNFAVTDGVRGRVSVALAGAEAQRWYQTSAKVIEEMFGPDAPRFTAFLAATSPNTSVKANLQGAMKFWRLWDEAGRPNDRKTLERFLRLASEEPGDTGFASGIGIGSGLNNVERVANASFEELLDPRFLEGVGGTFPKGEPPASKAGELFSGFKVSAFYANLMGNVQRVTIDTHILSGAGSNAQQVTLGRLLGASPSTRKVAQAVSAIVGRRVTPREIQAMEWSTIKAIRDLPGRDPMDVIRGLVGGTDLFGPQDMIGRLQGKIRETPSFASMMHDAEVAAEVARAGMDLPKLLPQSRDELLSFDPSWIRESDLVDLAERMSFRDAGQTLFGLSALAAMMAGESDQDSPLLAAMAAAGMGGRNGRAAVEAWSTLARRAARAAGVPQEGIEALEQAGVPMGPVMELLQEEPSADLVSESLGQLLFRLTGDARAGRNLRDAIIEGLGDRQPGGAGVARRALQEEAVNGIPSELDLSGLDADAIIATEELRQKGYRFVPGFFDESTGKTIPTGLAHDEAAIQDPVRRNFIGSHPTHGGGGFYDLETGQYLTREQTGALSGAEIGESSMVRQAELGRQVRQSDALEQSDALLERMREEAAAARREGRPVRAVPGIDEEAPWRTGGALDAVIDMLNATPGGPIRTDLLRQAREIRQGSTRANPRAFAAKLQNFGERNNLDFSGFFAETGL